MRLECLVPVQMLSRHAYYDWGDEDFQIENGELTIDFNGKYTEGEVWWKLNILREANKLFKKYSKFPFPTQLDGRPMSTELRFNFEGKKTYRAIVWDKEGDLNFKIGSPMVYTIFETDDLWDLREIAMSYDPKYNPKSLCY